MALLKVFDRMTGRELFSKIVNNQSILDEEIYSLEMQGAVYEIL